MRSVTAIAVSAFVAAGVSYQQGRRPPRNDVAVVHLPGSASVGVHQVTFDAPSAGFVSVARYVITSSGIGPGLTMTVQLLVAGTPACSLTIPCNGAEGTEVGAICNASASAGDDVDWLVSSSDCGERPTGNLSFAFRSP